MRLQATLSSRGHDVTVVTGDFDHSRKSHISKTKLVGSGVKVLHVPGYSKNVGLPRLWCHLVFALKLWFVAIGARWDVVVSSSIPPEVLVVSRFLRKSALVIDVRDLWPDALQSYGQPSCISRGFAIYCDAIFKRTLKHAHRIMVVAPGYRRWLDRYKAFVPGRVKFVPLGFRREDFRSLSNGSGVYSFCYAGGASPQFDIREFASEFGNQKGVVIGSGPLLKEWELNFPKTEFTGAISRGDAIEKMGKSRKLLFPSNPFARLPNKAFDYFALGRHVALGKNCTREARFLLSLRHRRMREGWDRWDDYYLIEKEAIASRAADIVERVVV